MDQLLQIALVTFVFSFGVQSVFFLYYKYSGNSLIKTHKSVMQYVSGIIGDGILIPLTNVFAYLTLKTAEINLNPYIILCSIVGGLVTVFIFHYGQAYFKLTNWSMPEKGLWNLLGVYHALFMFTESSFLCFVLISWSMRGFDPLATEAVYAGSGIMFLFFLTFVYDYWKVLFRKVFSF